MRNWLAGSDGQRLRRRATCGEGGFTLLEVLVATLIFSIAVISLLSAISTSLNNASRLSDYDQVSMLARRKMEELLTTPPPLGQPVVGVFAPVETSGFDAGWSAIVEPFEANATGRAGGVIDRVALEVWWVRDGRRRTMQVESFRARKIASPDEMGRYPHG